MRDFNDTSATSGNGQAAGGRRADPLGAAAEEALRLLDALQQRVAREIGKGLIKGGISGLGGIFGGDRGGDVWSEAVAESHDEEYICRACPVCRVIAARREAGADVADHLIAASGELFAAFREAVEALQRPRGDAFGTSGRARGEGPRSEHVDLG